MTYLQADDIAPMVSRDFHHNIRQHTGARVSVVLLTGLLALEVKQQLFDFNKANVGRIGTS